VETVSLTREAETPRPTNRQLVLGHQPVVQYHLVATAVMVAVMAGHLVAMGEMEFLPVATVVVPFLPVEATLPEVTAATAPVTVRRGINLLQVLIILVARFLAAATAGMVIKLKTFRHRLTSLVSSNLSSRCSNVVEDSLLGSRCVVAVDCKCSPAVEAASGLVRRLKMPQSITSKCNKICSLICFKNLCVKTAYQLSSLTFLSF
jgi:hypothetical protein